MTYPNFGIQSATIGGTATHTGAWFCTTLDLAIQPADYDGDNVVIDGVDDALARETIRVQRTETFDFDLNGHTAPGGSPYSDQIAGLASNKRLFQAAFFSGFDAAGTLPMGFVDADGTELSGRVQPLRCRFSPGLWACTAMLTLRFPYPLFVDGS